LDCLRFSFRWFCCLCYATGSKAGAPKLGRGSTRRPRPA